MTQNTFKPFRVVMRKARKEKLLTLRELGCLVGCKPSQLSEIESGIRNPPKQDEFIKKLCHALKLDFEKTKKLIQNEREIRDVSRFKFIFRMDDELASKFHRLGGKISDIELANALMEALNKVDL